MFNWKCLFKRKPKEMTLPEIELHNAMNEASKQLSHPCQFTEAFGKRFGRREPLSDDCQCKSCREEKE